MCFPWEVGIQIKSKTAVCWGNRQDEWSQWEGNWRFKVPLSSWCCFYRALIDSGRIPINFPSRDACDTIWCNGCAWCVNKWRALFQQGQVALKTTQLISYHTTTDALSSLVRPYSSIHTFCALMMSADQQSYHQSENDCYCRFQTFNGLNRKQCVRAFILSVEVLLSKYDDVVKCGQFINCLRGTPQRWYANLRLDNAPEVDSWRQENILNALRTY